MSYEEALGTTLIARTVREKIVLVGVTIPPARDDDTEADLDELVLLVDTAGADVVARVEQRRERPDPAYFIGKGKAEELRDLCLAVDADTVVFDSELSPAQQYNLEKLLGRTAIDRTAVILDIFAQNAHTLEGRAQVELALLRYRLPRLRRGAKARLSQQAGGIGTRQGAGETKLETDRRRLTRRIGRLEQELRDLRRNRQLQRRSRARSGLANVSIVGYTNAGKSTLLNRLTTAGVLVEDRLFATLDPTTRRLALPGGEPVLLTDTVGFVRRLPHGLVEAFKSTLEAVAEADLLVHVVDSSAPDPEAQIDAVHTVLAEIGADQVPELLVFNKADLAPEEARRQVKRHDGSVAISAKTGEGIDDLLAAVSDHLRALAVVTELLIPFDRGDVLAAVHREGEVLSSEHEDAGMRVRARLDGPSAGRLGEFIVGGDRSARPEDAGAEPEEPAARPR
jgi:GTPase